jgi:hypothetical protein
MAGCVPAKVEAKRVEFEEAAKAEEEMEEESVAAETWEEKRAEGQADDLQRDRHTN